MTRVEDFIDAAADAEPRCKAGDIFKLIPLIVTDVDPIAKSKKNQAQGYSFRGIDQVYNEIHPLLSKHGVFIVPFVVSLKREERETQRGGTMFYSHAIIDHRFYAPDGSYVTARTIGEAMDSGDKSSNKAQSAAMKYACIEVFAIPTEGDNDTENETPQVQPRREQPKNGNGAAPVPLATAADVNELRDLLAARELPDITLPAKWLGKANVPDFKDMTQDVIRKCIGYMRTRPTKPHIPEQPHPPIAAQQHPADAGQGDPAEDTIRPYVQADVASYANFVAALEVVAQAIGWTKEQAADIAIKHAKTFGKMPETLPASHRARFLNHARSGNIDVATGRVIETVPT